MKKIFENLPPGLVEAIHRIRIALAWACTAGIIGWLLAGVLKAEPSLIPWLIGGATAVVICLAAPTLDFLLPPHTEKDSKHERNLSDKNPTHIRSSAPIGSIDNHDL